MASYSMHHYVRFSQIRSHLYKYSYNYDSWLKDQNCENIPAPGGLDKWGTTGIVYDIYLVVLDHVSFLGQPFVKIKFKSFIINDKKP